jgi:hypothetical protein
MSHEDLRRDLEEREREDDARYRQIQAPKVLGAFKDPPKVDHDRAMARFKDEIAPVFERRKRAMTSAAYRLFLKATGQWKGMEAKDVQLVNPTRGLMMTGPTDDEIRALIAADPKAVKKGAALIPIVQAVNAQRRTRIEPILGGEARDD